jgi:hypothetical protein
MSEQELKAIDAEVREIVNAAADFAQRSRADASNSTPISIVGAQLKLIPGAVMPIQVLMPALSPTMERATFQNG